MQKKWATKSLVIYLLFLIWRVVSAVVPTTTFRPGRVFVLKGDLLRGQLVIRSELIRIFGLHLNQISDSISRQTQVMAKRTHFYNAAIKLTRLSNFAKAARYVKVP